MNVDTKRARFLARIGGVLYLVIIVLGALGEAVVRGRVVVSGNAEATVANLRHLEWLWRLGVAGEVVLLSCATGLAVILYILLRRVSADLARAAVLFNIVSIAIEGVAAVFLAAALFPLRPEQSNLALLAVRAHSLGFGIALVFFGIECILLGRLIWKSGYMPRLIGALMQSAGVCYIVNSFALLLSPPLSRALFPAILLPALIAELSLALWLVVKGVREEEWERYGTA